MLKLDDIAGYVLAIFFVVGLALWSSTHPSPHADNHAAENYCTNCTANEKPLSAEPNNLIFLNTPDDLIFGWPAIDVFTGLLFIATVALGCVTAWGIFNQSRETKILRRAYLSASPRGLHEMRDDTVIAHVVFINGGNLPARNVRNAVKIELSDDGEKAVFEDVKVEPGRMLITPKAKVERGTGELGKDSAEAYRNRLDGFYIYVWGRVEYEDGFGNDRWMIFCHRYNCAKPDAWRVHYHHNDGD
jgi:hypothetical protein